MEFLKPKKKESAPLTALHIDDSRWVRIPVSVILKRHFGMKVLEAGSGAEGLVIAEQEHPDIIILDVMMVDMDGFDTLVKLKENEKTRDIPVVMCTSRDLTREVNLAVRLGAVGYITKPIEEDSLVIKIRDILKDIGRWGEPKPPAHNPFDLPPDMQHDFVVPKDRQHLQNELSKVDPVPPEPEAETEPEPPAAPSRPCPFCQTPLTFIKQYDAWYCYPCQKYPDHI